MIEQSTNVSRDVSNPPATSPLVDRERISRWTKGVWTGLIAGTVLLGAQMFLAVEAGSGTVWNPIRLSASIALGSQAIAASAPFTFGILAIGVLVHFLISIWYAVVLGLFIRRLKYGMALLVGAGFGLLLYFVHFYGLTSMYPWVVNARGWIPVISHLAFGMSAAWVYSHLHMRELARSIGPVA